MSIRLINGLNFRDSVEQVMLQSHLLSVEQTLEFELACFIKKYNKSLLPPCFDDFFQTSSINNSAENITRSTRSSPNPVVPNQGSTDPRRVREKLAGGRECIKIRQN